MKVKIYFLLLGIIIIGNKISKAQAQYIDTNYKYTYKLKLQGVHSPGEAKIAKNNLINLFDSRHQTFSVVDSTITIRSSFNIDELVCKNKLQDNGYPVLLFSKTIDQIPINETKKEN
ncbi:MAG: hypothetical protein J0L87_14920 [Bacteroidetes bacterium]|nr:hypothetical protein [Bacteroidota bacterium]